MRRFEGRLISFFETGMEGTAWAMEQFGFSGYDGLVFLEEGDDITIFDDEGKQVYRGIIRKDTTTNMLKRPFVDIKQQAVLNTWVHWLQSDVDPETWAWWFFPETHTGVILRETDG